MSVNPARLSDVRQDRVIFELIGRVVSLGARSAAIGRAHNSQTNSLRKRLSRLDDQRLKF